MQMRESKLRKAGISGRARMASEMRDLDEDVSSLSRTLAVRTLQLEMEYIYGCLEEEALDVAQDLQGAGYLLLRLMPPQTGSTITAWRQLLVMPSVAVSAQIDKTEKLLRELLMASLAREAQHCRASTG